MSSINWSEIALIALIAIVFSIGLFNGKACSMQEGVLQNQVDLACVDAYETCVTTHEEATCARTLQECK
jgi:hypothetical protein